MRQRQKKQLQEQADQDRRMPVRPMNAKQGRFLKAIDRKELTIAYGPAGTSKTYLPAMRSIELLQTDKIKKIILCRPAVAGGGEKHGFLPGDMRRKIEPWALPILDVMEEKIGSRVKLDELIKQGIIDMVPFTFMRGRSFHNAFIILDEAQNTTPEQMKLFVTRLGQNSRTVISGDISGGQSDLCGHSGLASLVQMVKDNPIFEPFVDIIQFDSDDVVRSGLCQLFVKAYENTV